MKICHVLWGLTYGGIETMVSNIANEQAKAGHDVSLLIINDLVDRPMLDMIDPAVNVIFNGRPKGSRSLIPIVKLNTTLSDLSPDIIHFHHPGQRKLIYKPSLKKECTTLHIDCLPYLRPMVKNTPNLFTISKHVHDDVVKRTGKESEIVLNGIVSDKFKPRDTWFDKSSGRPFRILQLGRIDFSHKGQDVFIKALKLLKEWNFNVQADIIGVGDYFEKAQKLIEDFGLSDSVKMLGAKSQSYLNEHLRDYDLVVHPSRHEGFGLVIAEAMASKVPVLVSNIDVQLDLIDYGLCGYFFKNGKDKDMALAIVYIINNYSPALIERAYNRVKEKYDVKRTALNYLEKYSKL